MLTVFCMENRRMNRHMPGGFFNTMRPRTTIVHVRCLMLLYISFSLFIYMGDVRGDVL